jgi:hypothetical protein
VAAALSAHDSMARPAPGPHAVGLTLDDFFGPVRPPLRPGFLLLLYLPNNAQPRASGPPALVAAYRGAATAAPPPTPV